ncbi:MAG: hypothetical protein JEZ04_01425 [Spirochaetales bacterium]|nr:hypothetical protein [Spirochaetales bacterium]
MKKLIVILTVSMLLLSAIPVLSENIRGDVVNIIKLTDSSAPGDNEFTMGIEDVFAVSVDGRSEFIRGYAVKIFAPSELRRYGSSFAFNIYKQISPEITEGIGTYYGKKYDSIILPESAEFHIRIPVGERLPGEIGPYITVLSTLTSETDYPMMFTILPMMKGLPSSLYNSGFTISVSPIFRDSGLLSLVVIIPDGLDAEDLNLMIDNKAVDDDGKYKLASGSHSLTLGIQGGKNISRSFDISAGQTTNLNIEVEKLESTIFIDVPENTIIYIDGEKMHSGSENRMTIDPGEHLVLFKIGDYKISKKFEILPGKDCKISLFLDIFIEEN